VSRTGICAGGSECLIRELPPLTVNAPSAWRMCGTSHACLSSSGAPSRTLVLMIRHHPQHTVDAALTIIPEPECPNRWERSYRPPQLGLSVARELR